MPNIFTKGPRGDFERPWQNPVPPLTENANELIIKYPNDEENNGLFCMAWRGPSAVEDLYTVTAATLLLKYLTELSVSPLPKEFVEIEDPYASRVRISNKHSKFFHLEFRSRLTIVFMKILKLVWSCYLKMFPLRNYQKWAQS